MHLFCFNQTFAVFKSFEIVRSFVRMRFYQKHATEQNLIAIYRSLWISTMKQMFYEKKKWKKKRKLFLLGKCSENDFNAFAAHKKKLYGIRTRYKKNPEWALKLDENEQPKQNENLREQQHCARDPIAKWKLKKQHIHLPGKPQVSKCKQFMLSQSTGNKFQCNEISMLFLIYYILTWMYLVRSFFALFHSLKSNLSLAENFMFTRYFQSYLYSKSFTLFRHIVYQS